MTTTITAKDLTKEFPRSPYEVLGGIPWLARMIDKIRAHSAGTAGEYSPYPCGGDQYFLGIAGLDAAAVKSQVDAGKSDDEIVAWVKAQLAPGIEESFAAYKARMLLPAEGDMAGYLAEAKKEIAAANPSLDLSKADNFPRLICIEEGYALPGA